MLCSKTLYNDHYVFSSQRYKTYFFASVKHWQSPFHGFSSWYVKNKKHLIILAKYSFGLIFWKGDVCSLSCISNCLSRVTPQVCGEKQRSGVVSRLWRFYFIRKKFHCYFVVCVLFCAESMCRGSGNFMFGFPHFSVPDCWVSFLWKPLMAWEAVWWNCCCLGGCLKGILLQVIAPVLAGLYGSICYILEVIFEWIFLATSLHVRYEQK